MKRTTPITWARRRSSCRLRSTATSTRANTTSGKSSAAERRASGIRPCSFVTFTENHDQVANSARGERMDKYHSARAAEGHDGAAAAWPVARRCSFRARSSAPRSHSFTLPIFPSTSPNWCATGRREFLAQWRSIDMPEMQAVSHRSMFDRHVPRQQARPLGAGPSPRRSIASMRDLLRLRREDPALAELGCDPFRRRRAERPRVLSARVRRRAR